MKFVLDKEIEIKYSSAIEIEISLISSKANFNCL